MTTILLLSVIGILAVLAELVLPGGILGVVGAICLLGAVVTTFITYGATAGTIALAAVVAIGLVTLRIWMRFFHQLPFTKQLVLNETVGIDAQVPARAALVGWTGISLTELMPSGHAEIGGEKFDVMAEGAAIRRGATIVVVETRGPSVMVRETKES
ncbi:MAG: NfeD family protein [Verrucomicrobiales bacterium]|nr:NfeD family protein [Verrucomicrobiales bacterium]